MSQRDRHDAEGSVPDEQRTTPSAVVSPQRQARRARVQGALKLLALGGVLALVFAMLSALFSGSPENLALDRVVSLEGIAPGEESRVRWGGREIVILHRDAAMVAALDAPVALKDAASRMSSQPRELRNPHRSFDLAWFVAYAASTDLGCALVLVPPDEARQDPRPWAGGFRDECRGGRYDFAGRVLEGEPGLRNLEIPAYRWQPAGAGGGASGGATGDAPSIRLLAR